MQSRDKSNFLIEITPEVMAELNRLYMHSDTEPVVELHFSPYWGKSVTPHPNTHEDGGESDNAPVS